MRNAIRLLLVSCCLTLVASPPTLAQRRGRASRAAAATAQPAAVQATVDGLHFRSIGPATTSGRIDDFAVDEDDPAIFYIGTAMGGVWTTVNNGTTPEPVFDHEGSSSIGDVAIAPGDPNVVWVGTGEANNRQSSCWGDGIYKSTDGGKTWRHRGLTQSYHIARILVDPNDYDVVYVAAVGNLWAPGGEREVAREVGRGLAHRDHGPHPGGARSLQHRLPVRIEGGITHVRVGVDDHRRHSARRPAGESTRRAPRPYGRQRAIFTLPYALKLPRSVGAGARLTRPPFGP